MPVDLRQDAFGVLPGEAAGIHESLPAAAGHPRRIGTLAEEPEQPGRIAVEDRMVEPDISLFRAVAERMAFEHGPVADDQPGNAGAEVDQPQAVGVGIGGMTLRRYGSVGIAVAAPRNPPEIQRHPISPVRRNRIDGAFIPADDTFADLKNPGDRLLLLRVEIVVDEAVRPPRQEKFHAALLVTPAPGAGQRLVTAFAVEQADFGGLAGKRQPFALRRLQRQVAAAVAVPRVAVVVAEEVVAVVRRDLLPFVFGMDQHGIVLYK